MRSAKHRPKLDRRWRNGQPAGALLTFNNNSPGKRSPEAHANIDVIDIGVRDADPGVAGDRLNWRQFLSTDAPELLDCEDQQVLTRNKAAEFKRAILVFG